MEALDGFDRLLSNIDGSGSTTIVLVLIGCWLITRPKDRFSKEILSQFLKGIIILALASQVGYVLKLIIQVFS